MEIQAHQFAGRILVPTNKLMTAVNEAKQKLADETEGLTPKELTPSALSYMAGYIADRFHVSTQVVEIRMQSLI